MTTMNIKQLKEAIAGMPDDAPVLIDNGSHGAYPVCDFNVTILAQHNGAEDIYTEDIFIGNIGDQYEYGRRIAALVLA